MLQWVCPARLGSTSDGLWQASTRSRAWMSAWYWRGGGHLGRSLRPSRRCWANRRRHSQDAFRAAQVEAMANQLGLWSPATCAGDTTQPADNVGSAPQAPVPPPPGAVVTPAASTNTGFDPTQYIGQGNRYNCSDFK